MTAKIASPYQLVQYFRKQQALMSRLTFDMSHLLAHYVTFSDQIAHTNESFTMDTEFLHGLESRYPGFTPVPWMPASAGMTVFLDLTS